MMNATSNPQAVAGQRRKNYRDVTDPDTGTVTAIMALASFALVAAIILGVI